MKSFPNLGKSQIHNDWIIQCNHTLNCLYLVLYLIWWQLSSGRVVAVRKYLEVVLSHTVGVSSGSLSIMCLLCCLDVIILKQWCFDGRLCWYCQYYLLIMIGWCLWINWGSFLQYVCHAKTLLLYCEWQLKYMLNIQLNYLTFINAITS